MRHEAGARDMQATKIISRLPGSSPRRGSPEEPLYGTNPHNALAIIRASDESLTSSEGG